MYEITKAIRKGNSRQAEHVIDTKSTFLTKEKQVQSRLAEHFNEFSIRPEPPELVEIDTEGITTYQSNT